MKNRAGIPPLARLYLLVGSLFLFLTLNCPAAESAQWVKRYNGPGNGIDRGVAVAVDSAGYVYVAGYLSGISSGYDFAVIKYDSGGIRKWVARYNGPGNGDDCAVAIALDGAGNVYVAGYSKGVSSGADFAVVKYDANGKEKWVRRYNGSANSGDYLAALVVDASGNVYVAGGSENTSTGTDYTTIKYDASGNRKWVKTYNGPGNSADQARSIAVDDSGNVFVTGDSFGSSSGWDYATVKYNSNGKELWAKRYNGPANGMDRAYALALDSAGNVYITGESYGTSSDMDYTTIKYDTNGNRKWVKTYNGPANGQDSATALAVDAAGNVYVTGQSYGTVTGPDYATVKYDTNGKQKWVKTYSGSATEYTNDIAWALALDAAGAVYVTGQSQRAATGLDYATVKYDATGKQKWSRRYNGPGNGDDSARAIAVDASGNSHVVGDSLGSTTDIDYATIKYDTNGN